MQLQAEAVIGNVASRRDWNVIVHLGLPVLVQRVRLISALFSGRGYDGDFLRLDALLFPMSLIDDVRLDPEPRRIECRKEEQDQHRADRRAADQRVSHRSPEDRVCEGNEGQHGGKRGQDDRTGPLYRRLDDGVMVV